MKNPPSPRCLWLSLISLSAFGSTLVAQTPAIRWTFDNASGAPTKSSWVSGGDLAIDLGSAGKASFQATGGVSSVTPGVYDGTMNVYGDAFSSMANSANSPLSTESDLARFVITMWIKPTIPPADQPYATLLNISAALSEKSDPGFLFALNGSEIEVGVNGFMSPTKLSPDVIVPNTWVFIAFVYDGLAENPYYSPEMATALGSEYNSAILTGTIENPVTLSGRVGINTGAPTYKVAVGPFGFNGLSVSIGSSNGNAKRAFCGFIDDIRIYNGLLNARQIDAVRRSALVAP